MSLEYKIQKIIKDYIKDNIEIVLEIEEVEHHRINKTETYINVKLKLDDEVITEDYISLDDINI